MAQAFILGCSHAAGCEMASEPGLEFADDEAKEYFEASNSYPALIAKGLGYTPLNYALTGSSNDSMFRIFLTLINQIKPNDLVIACWTGVDRTEVLHQNKFSWVQISSAIGLRYHPGKYLLSGYPTGKISNAEEYEQYAKQWISFSSEQQGKLNKTKNILALNFLCREKQLRVLNFDSFWPVDPDHVTSCDWPVKESFWNWAKDRKYTLTPYSHYFFEAHESFANHVLQSLANKAVTDHV